MTTAMLWGQDINDKPPFFWGMFLWNHPKLAGVDAKVHDILWRE